MLSEFECVSQMLDGAWESEFETEALRPFSSIELFAGAGGLALGLEMAGFSAVMLNELDKDACATLKHNRPHWNVQQGDVAQVDFSSYRGVDLVAGGFPCQAFSYAGKKLGMDDIRGTLFYEFARCVRETQPKVFLAENVRGLLTHDEGRTLESILSVFSELGYDIISPKLMRAIHYMVPQKRERLFIVGLRKDLRAIEHWKWPIPYKRVLTMRDALKQSILYSDDCPPSPGQAYPKRKKEILELVPQGGYWRDLPDDIQREYMQTSYFQGGGKTGIARRLSWDEPSLTLTCAPAQKQTERCHPDETRPLAVREYARIQTFPDEWHFCGALCAQYKQIGNAVPVNLSFAMGRALIRLLNAIE